MIIALLFQQIKKLYYDKVIGKGCCEWADYFLFIATNNNIIVIMIP